MKITDIIKDGNQDCVYIDSVFGKKWQITVYSDGLYDLKCLNNDTLITDQACLSTILKMDFQKITKNSVDLPLV